MSSALSSITSFHEKRKTEHIDISLNRDVSSKGATTGFEEYRFVHQALPEIDLEDIDLSTEFLRKRISAPVFISSMVGGVDEAGEINRNLALAAREIGLPMGVGSLRCAVDDPGVVSSFRVRQFAPDIFLAANLGAVQLNYGYGIDECIRAVEMIEADALILHLNPLQEAVQAGGNTRFSGLLNKIESVARALSVPVIIKEVGSGLSRSDAARLADAGAGALDVAGAGGTSWSEVEKFRAAGTHDFNIAAAFSGWGIPTAESVIEARTGAPAIPLIASGGIRSGIDAAKAIALGADCAGIALPLLKAAMESAETVTSRLLEIIEQLRITLFCTGCPDLAALKKTPRLTRRK